MLLLIVIKNQEKKYNFFPTLLTQSWNKLISVIDTPLWLEIFFVIIILLRIPSFFEPYYYGDEMIYLTLGEGIRQGIPLYSGLHDNKPPLLYLTAALAGNVFVFKVLLAAFNLVAIYLFWKLTKILFQKNDKLSTVSTIIFGIFSTLPLLEGNIANAENFMVVPVLLAIIYAFTRKDSLKNMFLIGVLFSIASLFKIVAAFDILGLIAFWLIFTKKGNFILFIKKIFFLSLGFVIPISLTFVWYYFRGALSEYVIAAYLQNFGYLSSWKRSAVEVPFLVKNAPLLIRFGIMLFGFFVLWLLRNKLSRQFIFVTAWLLATLFAVTLSERPYPHYFLQSLAPISILFGMLFTFKNVEQSLTVIPLTLAFFVPFYFKFWYYQTVPYYERFIKFATRQITRDEYFNMFSPQLNNNYEIADFLTKSAKKTDKVFVWSNDSSAIYSLSRRLPPTKYVADYHFRDFSTEDMTIAELEQTMPKFVVVTPNSYPFPKLDAFLNGNYYIISEIGSSQIWLYLQK